MHIIQALRMKPILICTDPPEIRENIKVVHPIIMDNPDLDKEEDQPLALPFHTQNCSNIIINPMMIIYSLKCILKPSVVALNLIFCIYGVQA